MIVVILAAVLVRMFARSGGGAPNMVDLATKDTATVAQIVRSYDTAVLDGNTFFTTDAKGLSDIYTALKTMYDNDDARDSTVETLRKNANIWFFVLVNEYESVDATNVSAVNPTRSGCYTILARSSLSAKEAADLLSTVAPYDQCIFYSYGVELSVYGYAKGNGCVSEFDTSDYADSYKK